MVAVVQPPGRPPPEPKRAMSRPAPVNLADALGQLAGSPAALTVWAIIACESRVGHRLAEDVIENAVLVRARQLANELAKAVQHSSSPNRSLIEGLSANGRPFISGLRPRGPV